jgi:hypothetical protein
MDETPEVIAHYISLGRITFAWTSIETCVDIWVNYLYRTLDCKCNEPRIPRFIKRKIDYLKRAIPTIPQDITHLKEEWLSLVRRIAPYASRRDMFSHSSVLGLGLDRPKLRFIQSIYSEHTIKLDEDWVNPVQLEKLGHEMNALAKDVALFATIISSYYLRHTIQKEQDQ